MTSLRAIGHFAGAVALAAALAGCGDGGDGDSTVAGDGGSAAEESAETTDGGGDDQDGAGGGDGDNEGSADSSADSSADDGGSDATAPGVYKDYSADAVADASYDTTILFFHASWCPECRAFDAAIQDQDVPDGVQILKTDYDSEQELKARYEVTHQSWFVKVDSDGNKLSDWLGYGEDKSVDTILEQLG